MMAKAMVFCGLALLGVTCAGEAAAIDPRVSAGTHHFEVSGKLKPVPPAPAGE